MTVYEFFIDCADLNSRLEVPIAGVSDAVTMFKRLDDLAANGAGRLVSEMPGHAEVAGLTLDDVRHLLHDRSELRVGPPKEPGRLLSVDEVLLELPADARFTTFYYEV